jgi:hypothetical protein
MEVLVQRFLFFVLVGSFAVFFAGAGCKKSDDGGDDSTITGPDGSAVPQNANCANVSVQSTIPDCDLCTRDQCCVNVLDCENTPDCKSYRTCIAPCKPGDLSCSDACTAKHQSGQRLVSIISQCAEVRCSEPCGISVEIGDGG